MDGNGLIVLGPVASCFTGMKTNAAACGRERVFGGYFFISFFKKAS